MLQRIQVYALDAAPLTNSAPTLPDIGKQQFKKYAQTAEERAAGRTRKVRQLARERKGRIPLDRVEPDHDRLCRALARFTQFAEPNANPALRKALAAIERNTPGWQNDKVALAVLVSAIADGWADEWLG